jgi:serine/threonine protein phosphatase PrpC
MQVEAFNFQGKRSTNLDVIKQIHYENCSIFLVIDGFNEEHLARQQIESFIDELFFLVGPSITYSEFLDKFKKINKFFNASVSIVWLEKNKCHVSFCGDCRVYLNGNLKTVDHTQAWKMCSRKSSNINLIGELCITHPYQNVLLKSMKNDECEITTFDLQSGDEVIIITDGGWQELHHKIVNELFDTAELCNELFNDNASGFYIKRN